MRSKFLVLVILAVALVGGSHFASNNCCASPVDQTSGAAPSPDAAPSPALDVSRDEEPQGDKVVVYYFHGAARCFTCRTIEALTRKSIEGGFAEEVARGHVELESVNVELPENEHFVQDFQLFTRSVVVARKHEGEIVDWSRLDRVWQLVRNERAFLDYVRGAIFEKLPSES